MALKIIFVPLAQYVRTDNINQVTAMKHKIQFAEHAMCVQLANTFTQLVDMSETCEKAKAPTALVVRTVSNV